MVPAPLGTSQLGGRPAAGRSRKPSPWFGKTEKGSGKNVKKHGKARKTMKNGGFEGWSLLFAIAPGWSSPTPQADRLDSPRNLDDGPLAEGEKSHEL